jgi:hypothetical protein
MARLASNLKRQSLAQSTDEMAQLQNVEVVCLTGRAAPAAAAVTFASVVAVVLDLTSRQQLKLSSCPTDNVDKAAFERLGDCAVLTTLILSGCSGIAAAALERLGDCPALDTLDLSGNS